MAYQGPPSVHNGLLRKNKQPPRPLPVRNNRSNARPLRDMPEFDSGMGSSARGNSFNGSKPMNSIVPKELNKEEKYILQDTIDENKRKNFFKRIFPSVDYLYYK